MTPIEQIKEWITDKPSWWKHCIKLALQHGELDQNALNEVYNIAQLEHGLISPSEKFIFENKELDFTGLVSESSKVNLISLSKIYGIGTLSAEETLQFEKNGMFVIYGDNGAGKSSYASIMKHACLTRGSIPAILGNVFEPTPPKPSAEISVLVNDKPEYHIWNLEKASIPALKAIRVFDTYSAHHYVNKEDALGFKPAGLNLLTELTKSITHIRAIIDEDLMPGNGFFPLISLSSTTNAGKFFNSISAETKEEDVIKHLASKEDLSNITHLQNEILQCKLQTPESLKEKLNKQKTIILPLQRLISNILKNLGDRSFLTLSEMKIDYTKKKYDADRIMQATLTGLPLDTIAGINWKNLWSAAKTFIENEPRSHNFPPQEGEYCPFCLQEISATSSSRLVELNKYLSDNASKEASDAFEIMNNTIQSISSQNVTLEDQQAALNEVEMIKSGIKQRVLDLFETLSIRQNIFTSSSVLPSSQHPLDISVEADISKIIQDITFNIENVKTNDDLIALINKKEIELEELQHKKYITENYNLIIKNIRRHQVIKKMEAIRRDCNTRRVSDLSSKIYQQGIIEPLKTAFNDELQRFGFKRFSVEVNTRNSGGLQQFKLAISNAGEPIVAKVASEGEQRCIAIAAFLAEMTADNRKSAVIFDDPVNSLSHQWSSKVAARLIAESKTRQIIVFTHDIVFFKLLFEQAEIQEAQLESISLVRSRKCAGLVRDSAPWEAQTTSKRLKYLNTKLQELRKTEDNQTEDDFRLKSREFYSLLRESWERLVEEKLLNKVVGRFERGIATQRLSKLIDITETDILRINNAMSKCSTYFTGHDSAPAMGDPYPTLEEIENDLKNINDFLDELQNKRKRS